MQRIFAPLLLVLFTVFGCIPDLPDAFEQTYVCQSDDDCINTQGQFFVCYKWLEALHESGFGDPETDYSKGVCVNAENSSGCSETQNCPDREICYGSDLHNQCLNPCDAVGTTFCSRYAGLECYNDRQLPGGFACQGCNDNDQCPGNHRCVAPDNPADPGICVPQCDKIGDQCAHYRGGDGHCLVLEGVKGNTTEACAPCSADSICADMSDCDFSADGQGGYFTDALACTGNATDEKCNYDGSCDADETNCSDCQSGNSCDFDGTCEGHEYDCPDCVISCIEENPYCDDHEYCAENNGTKFCRCDCDYNTGDCDYNNDGEFMGEMCRCDADCHDAMQGCLDNPAYLDGSGFCVITEVNGDNIPTSDVMNFCGNVEGKCTDINNNNNDGVCASVLLAEEWLESTEERNAESVCIPCPEECAGDCVYNVWDDVAYGEPANEYVRCRFCDSHAECAQIPGLTFCMTIDAEPYCMFSTCTNATECGEGESCVDFGDEEKRCAPVCDDDESDSAGDDCTLPTGNGGICNWVTKYDAEGAAETEVVCIPCFCAEGCRCLDGNCSNEARVYTDALECTYECTQHTDCFSDNSDCYSCVDNTCQSWGPIGGSGCTGGTSCLVYEYDADNTTATCAYCGNNDDCNEGQICRTTDNWFDCVDCQSHGDCAEGYGCDTWSGRNECTPECADHSDCFTADQNCNLCDNGACSYRWTGSCGDDSCLMLAENSTICAECGNDADCSEEGEICNSSHVCVECEDDEHCEPGFGCNFIECTLQCDNNADCYTEDDNCNKCQDGLCTLSGTNACSLSGKKCYLDDYNNQSCIACLSDTECGEEEICTHKYRCRQTCENDTDCGGNPCVTLWQNGSPQGVCYEALDGCLAQDIGSNEWGGSCSDIYSTVCVNVLGWNSNGDETLDLNDTTFSTCVACPTSCSGTNTYCRAKNGSYYLDDNRVDCIDQNRDEALQLDWCSNGNDDDYDGAIDEADPDCFAARCRTSTGADNCNEDEHCKSISSAESYCSECLDDSHCADEQVCQINTYANTCECDVAVCEGKNDGSHCYDNECTTSCNGSDSNCSGSWICDGSQCTHNYGGYCESNAECTSNDCYCGCDTIDGTCNEGCACDSDCTSGAGQGGTCISGPETECSDILDNNNNDVSDCDDLACAEKECSILHPGKICADSGCTAAPTGGQGCPSAAPWDTQACTCPFAANNTSNDYSNAWTGSGNSVCAYGLSADEVFIESTEGSSPTTNQHDYAEPDMIVDKGGNPWIVYRDTDTNDIYLRRWDPTEGAWLYWDRMLEFWTDKFPAFPLNTRYNNYDGLAMPRLTYEKINVDVGAGTAEEVEVVAIVWAEKLICSQESYVCGDLTESMCENAWECEWDGDSCEYNQTSGSFNLPCDSDVNCPGSHTCSYNTDSTWTNTCCDIDITDQSQSVQALAFAKAASESTWQHKFLNANNTYENSASITYTVYDPDITIVTHGTTTNASNPVEPGDVALSYVVKNNDSSSGITTWKIPVSSYTFKDPSAIYACYYWKKEICSQYIGNYDSCVEQGCIWNSSSDDCYASNSSACLLPGDIEGVGTYAGDDDIGHKLEANTGDCTTHMTEPTCTTAGCHWGGTACSSLPYLNVSRPDLSWSRIYIDCDSRAPQTTCEADSYCFWNTDTCEAPVSSNAINNDWTYYIAWEQDGYIDESGATDTAVDRSSVFVRRLDPDNEWGDAGSTPAGHATDESYGLSADTTQDFSQPRIRNNAYGVPRMTFLNDTQEVKGLHYKTDGNAWEATSAVNDVNNSDPNPLLGTLDYETSACGHHILGWQNDCDSYTTQSECEEKGCAWNGGCTEVDSSSSNVQIVGHFNDDWTTMGRAKSATDPATILAQINDASGVASQLSFAFGPRDTNHKQTLCATWRNKNAQNTYGLYAVCKEMDTDSASTDKYCCDEDVSGECGLKAAGVSCTANYECDESGICDSTNVCASGT
jgi:hypothetical protein